MVEVGCHVSHLYQYFCKTNVIQYGTASTHRPINYLQYLNGQSILNLLTKKGQSSNCCLKLSVNTKYWDSSLCLFYIFVRGAVAYWLERCTPERNVPGRSLSTCFYALVKVAVKFINVLVRNRQRKAVSHNFAKRSWTLDPLNGLCCRLSYYRFGCKSESNPMQNILVITLVSRALPALGNLERASKLPR